MFNRPLFPERRSYAATTPGRRRSPLARLVIFLFNL